MRRFDVTRSTVRGAIGKLETEPSEITTTGADEDSCEDILSGEAMKELTGEQDAFRLDPMPDGELAGCQALITGDARARITVIRVAATEWAESAASGLTQVAKAGQAGEQAADIKALAAKAESGEISETEACTLFALRAEALYDGAPDASLVVDTGQKGGLDVMSAESCTGDRYTLVELEAMSKWADEDAVREKLVAAIAELNPGASLAE